MATKNLDELKSTLYDAFDYAAGNGLSNGAGTPESRAQNRVAMGKIAEAIVAIEREQREAQEVRPAGLLGKTRQP